MFICNLVCASYNNINRKLNIVAFSVRKKALSGAEDAKRKFVTFCAAFYLPKKERKIWK